MSNAQKFILFSVLILLMLGFVFWIFYMSEPKYIDNCNNKPIEKFDYVTTPHYSFQTDDRVMEVDNGIVLQVDSNRAIIKNASDKWHMTDCYEVSVNDRGSYRIIGKGTFYHKVNSYIGFNIMMVTQAFLIIMIVILFATVIKLWKSFDI